MQYKANKGNGVRRYAVGWLLRGQDPEMNFACVDHADLNSNNRRDP